MSKTILYIVFAGLISGFLLYNSDKRELSNSILYDGCYEKYTSHHINADEFTKFMSNCMK